MPRTAHSSVAFMTQRRASRRLRPSRSSRLSAASKWRQASLPRTSPSTPWQDGRRTERGRPRMDDGGDGTGMAGRMATGRDSAPSPGAAAATAAGRSRPRQQGQRYPHGACAASYAAPQGWPLGYWVSGAGALALRRGQAPRSRAGLGPEPAPRGQVRRLANLHPVPLAVLVGRYRQGPPMQFVQGRL